MESNTSGLRGSEVEPLEEETVATEEIVASEEPVAEDADVEAMAELKVDPIQAVSYTHLTLPTIYSV